MLRSSEKLGVYKLKSLISNIERQSSYSGRFEWIADPIFRPTVGLYVDGQLIAVSPTWRERASDGRWLCHYAFGSEVTDGLHEQAITISCLETGDYLDQVNDLLSSSDRLMTVEDLLRYGQGQRCAWPGDGFLTFLNLPAVDQIDLLYNDILRRAVDLEAMHSFADALFGRHMTILDVRDRLICSAEFMGQRRSRDERVGHWIIWTGLEEIAPHLATTRSVTQDSPRTGLDSVQVAGSRLFRPLPEIQAWDGGYMARLAFGSNTQLDDHQTWLSSEPKAIAPSSQASSQGDESVAGLGNRSKDSVVFRGILSSMRAGPAGRTGKGTISTVSGRKGIVCFGPYLQPRAGHYRLKLKIAFGDGAELPMSGALLMEARYSDFVLASRTVPLTDIEKDSLHLSWDISPEASDVFQKPLLEFRLATDGLGSVAVQAIDLTISEYIREKQAIKIADWGSDLQIGNAGVRVEGAIAATKGVAGHVFYGPYASLAPGAYFLEIGISSKPSLLRKFRNDFIVTEVCRGDRVVASQRIPIAEIRDIVSLPFVIDDITGVILRKNIEFRLYTTGKSEFVINFVRSRTG